jgi:DNA invertase Pin-like site-specific DNA recombinase
MSVFAYIRVSGVSRSASQLLLEQSEEQIGQYCQQKQLDTAIWRRERSISGLIPLGSRPTGKRLLEELSKGDLLVVSRFDHLFQSGRDALLTLKLFSDKGVLLHCLDAGGLLDLSASNHLLWVVLEATANERKTKKEKESGSFAGGDVPFGFKVDDAGNLVEHPQDQVVLKEMKKLREEGVSFRAISEQLLKRTPPVKLSHSGIRKILLGKREADQ